MMNSQKIKSQLIYGAVVLCLFTRIEILYAQVDDFSLNSNMGGNNSKNNAPVNDFENENAKDLFGDDSIDFPEEDSKSKVIKEGPPVNVKKENSVETVPATPASVTPAAVASPAPMSAAAPAAAPAVSATSTPAPIPTTEPAATLPVAAQPIAPLSGDGSMAPVKENQKFAPNDFGGVPPMPGTRKQLATGEAPEMYDVEEGDTMFDVCSQLIDDGNYWPKLWSLNPDVKNPHFIYPGMKLAFYSGDQETPPFIEVVTEDEVVPVDKAGVTEVELVAEEVPVGGAIGRSDLPIMTASSPSKIAGSLDDATPMEIIGPGEIGSEGDALDGFIFGAKIQISDKFDFTIPAFIFESELEVLGNVIGGQAGQGLTGDDAKTFIEANDRLNIGTYSILRPNGPVEGYVEGGSVGVRYDYIGNVRVMRQTKNGFYEGTIFNSIWGARSGDIIVNFMATQRSVDNISTVGPVSTANSSIIGFASHGKRTGGKGDIVYLEKQGLSAGSFYAVYQNDGARELHHQRMDALYSEGGVIAVVRVLEIAGNSALGVIVGGTTEVKMGDALSL